MKLTILILAALAAVLTLTLTTQAGRDYVPRVALTNSVAVVEEEEGEATEWVTDQSLGGNSQIDSYLGVKITVGSSAITIKEVSVYTSGTDGYVSETPFRLYAADGTNMLQSTTIDCSAGTVGRKRSGTLTWELSASTSYFLMVQPSQQTMPGTATTVTTTTAATNNGYAFNSSGTMTLEGAAGTCYGAISFKYE